MVRARGESGEYFSFPLPRIEETFTWEIGEWVVEDLGDVSERAARAGGGGGMEMLSMLFGVRNELIGVDV